MSNLMKWKIRAAKKRKKEEDFKKIAPDDPNYFTEAEINQAVKEQNMPDSWKEDKMRPTSPYTTRLAIAVMNGKKVEVQNLLDRNADVNLISQGELPIIIAMGKRIMHNQKDSDEIVKMLIDKGADVKKSQEYGDTALHIAVLAHKQGRESPGSVEVPIIDNKKVIKMLIEAGADITIKNKSGETPIDIAKRNKDKDSLLKLLENKSGGRRKRRKNKTKKRRKSKRRKRRKSRRRKRSRRRRR